MMKYFLKKFSYLRHGTEERGKAWERISESLNSRTEFFKVSQRSVRDRYSVLEKKYKQKQREEERASGIETDKTEIDKAIRDIIEQFDEGKQAFKRASEEKIKLVEEESSKAQEMRRQSLETFAETKKDQMMMKNVELPQNVRVTLEVKHLVF